MTQLAAQWLVLLVPVFPAVLALVSASRRMRFLLPMLCLIAPVPALVAAMFVPTGTGAAMPWLLLDTRLGLDAAGRVFLLLFSVLWLIGSWHALFYLRHDGRRSAFAVWFLLAMAGAFGAAVAQDPLAFYTGFAVMSFSSYGLVVHDRKPQSFHAGRIYIRLVVVGELSIFGGLALSAAAVASPFAAQEQVPALALLLLATGLAIKAGLIPVHVWLPLAHPAAPAPASAVLSGAMIKVGLLGALRFMPFPFPGAGEALIILGAISAVFGVGVGTLQTNPKALLAYSSISQMGLVAIGLGLAMTASDPAVAGGAVAATILFALHHGLAKAALFFASVASPATFAGWRRMIRVVALLIPAAALAGAPLTSGAIAKTALKAVDAGPVWIDLFLSASSAATALLLARFVFLVWRREEPEKPGTLAPWLASAILSASTLWLWPQAATFLGYTMTLSAVVASLVPVILGGAAGIGAAWVLRHKTSPVVAPGDVLNLFYAPRVLGSERETVETQGSAVPAMQARLGSLAEALVAADRRLQLWRIGAILMGAVGFALFMAIA